MSASTEKKLRRQAREAGTDKKAIAAAEAAKQKAKSKRRWTIGGIAVIVAVALVIFLGSGILNTAATALTIGDEKYSPADVNYQYSGQYYTFANQYGSYASIFGLDTSYGVAGAASQPCTMLENGTWRDYFLTAAKDQMVQLTALADYAEANGISLTEEELQIADELFNEMAATVETSGFSSVDKYLTAMYGSGVDSDVVRRAELLSALATKAGNSYQESLQYSDAELEEYYKSLEGANDLFDYYFYRVEAEATEVTGADGSITTEVSAEALAKAEDTANLILDAYNKAEGDYLERFSSAVSELVADTVPNVNTAVKGSSLSSVYSEWMMGKRSAGDAAVFEDANAQGYYVVVFSARNDNHYNSANIRHILIKAIPAEDGTYTDESKAAALARAQEILAEFEAGERTEESFAALAELYSEDVGSNTNGGLYENVGKGQMVEEFDAFCFAGHESGTTGIVYGESASYAGYHVMYYVGEGELYSNVIARDELVNTAMTEWLAELVKNYEAKEGYFMRLVG